MGIKQRTVPRFQVLDGNGVPLVGGLVYTYQPGTSTAKATYTDYTGDTPNANPVVLDARGEANIWFDGTYKVIVKDSSGNTLYTQDNYGEGEDSVLTGNFNIVKNGSFEIDTNGDGVPDDWDVVEYTGGTVSIDSAEQIHGLYSLKFVSVGTGGGYATTDYFEVEGSNVLPVSFAIISSVATVHNQVDVIWHTAAKAVISTSTIHDDTATNPTSWTDYNYNTTAPATARFAKVRLYGCKDDDAQAGTTRYDNVVVEASSISGLFPNVNAAVTASDEELNVLDGMTASTAELNILDGVTATYQELNYVDITTLGTGAASKAVILDANGDYVWLPTGTLTYKGTAVTATGAELNYLDITTLGTGAASKAVVLDAGDDYTWPATGILTYGVLKDSAGTTMGATAAEINNACDVSGRVQTITASGAVTSGKQLVQLNHATVNIAATIADSTNHQGLFIVKHINGAAINHTVTITSGTWDGTNHTATLGNVNDALVVYFDTSGNGTIIENVGLVALS